MVMDKNLEPQSKASERDPIGTKKDHGLKSKMYFGADTLRRHVQGHNEEKLNKCNQCDFATFQAGHLRRHLKTHSGKNSN